VAVAGGQKGPLLAGGAVPWEEARQAAGEDMLCSEVTHAQSSEPSLVAVGMTFYNDSKWILLSFFLVFPFDYLHVEAILFAFVFHTSVRSWVRRHCFSLFAGRIAEKKFSAEG
jgi:hypothetical protein